MCLDRNLYFIHKDLYTYLIGGYLAELRVDLPRLRIKYLLGDLTFMAFIFICYTCLYRYKKFAPNVSDALTLKLPIRINAMERLQLIRAAVQSIFYGFFGRITVI